MDKRLRSNFFPSTIFSVYISNLRSQITYLFVKFDCLFVFFLILQIWYVKVGISQSVSEGTLDFEITRVDCMYSRTSMGEHLLNHENMFETG